MALYMFGARCESAREDFTPGVVIALYEITDANGYVLASCSDKAEARRMLAKLKARFPAVRLYMSEA